MRLFGPVNRYEGTVRGGSVSTPLGAIAARDVPESSRVNVAVRADGIEFRTPSPARDGGVRARVRSVRRLGVWTLVLMTPCDANREAAGAAEGAEPASIQARLPGIAPVACGDEVALRARPEHTFVFPSGGRRI